VPAYTRAQHLQLPFPYDKNLSGSCYFPVSIFSLHSSTYDNFYPYPTRIFDHPCGCGKPEPEPDADAVSAGSRFDRHANTSGSANPVGGHGDRDRL
jgi:hypothetical protein